MKEWRTYLLGFLVITIIIFLALCSYAFIYNSQHPKQEPIPTAPTILYSVADDETQEIDTTTPVVTEVQDISSSEDSADLENGFDLLAESSDDDYSPEESQDFTTEQSEYEETIDGGEFQQFELLQSSAIVTPIGTIVSSEANTKCARLLETYKKSNHATNYPYYMIFRASSTVSASALSTLGTSSSETYRLIASKTSFFTGAYVSISYSNLATEVGTSWVSGVITSWSAVSDSTTSGGSGHLQASVSSGTVLSSLSYVITNFANTTFDAISVLDSYVESGCQVQILSSLPDEAKENPTSEELLGEILIVQNIDLYIKIFLISCAILWVFVVKPFKRYF